MIRDKNRLYDLTDTNSPAETLAEIKNILLLIDPPLDPSPIEKVYADVLRLFKGQFPGYRASNTKYHNLEHTCSTALATARLIHGLHVQRQVFSPRIVQLCLIGALFHDTGLIQTEEEVKGTGAQYTIGHEDRLIAFMEKYLTENGYSQEDISRFTNRRAGSPQVGSNRRSRAPSLEKLKPRVGSANWSLDTPRSKTAPSTATMSICSSTSGSSQKFAWIGFTSLRQTAISSANFSILTSFDIRFKG